MSASGVKLYQALQRWTIVVYLLGAECSSIGSPGNAGPASQSEDDCWKRVRTEAQQRYPSGDARQSERSHFRLDRSKMEAVLARAPRQRGDQRWQVGQPIQLPLPNGELRTFMITESPVMEDELSSKYPRLRTYAGHAVDNPEERVRLNLTAQGLHALIIGRDRHVFIDPMAGDDGAHDSYFKDAAARSEEPFECLSEGEASMPVVATSQAASSGNSLLRVVRLALAATGEYTQFHGGTTEGALAGIVTAVNRLNAIYESELALRFVLVANNDLLIFTNAATDPYSGSDALSMLSQNQATLDALIGDASYDVGHVFSTGGGGLAQVGGAFLSGWKAQGVTGRASPVGDPFYIDYVAHELGHQLGAHHTFNGVSGACSAANRHASAAYEPGSGSTIMGYAGLCGADNLQPSSDAYFHAASLREIQALLASRGVSSQLLDNRLPIVDAGPDRVVPKGTPFVLAATGWDEDGDTLTYCWEQMDLGPATLLTAPDSGSGPLFRSRPPVVEPTRCFPDLALLLEGGLAAGEPFATTARVMSFCVTVRDGSATAADTMQLTVASAGPFSLSYPDGGEVCSVSCNVKWQVAGTDVAPVSASSVDILLSTNGGLDYPIMLAAGTPNDGAESVELPDVYAEHARVMVRASASVFFTVSGDNFVIHPHSGPPEFLVETLMMTNGTALLIPAVNTYGNASVYPLSIVVEQTNATIEDVSVVLDGLSHTWSPDLDILLVPPVGAPIVLLSDVGSLDGLSGARLEFSDSGSLIPMTGLPGSGHYLPTNIGTTGDVFPVSGPHDTSFAGLRGLSPAGVWSLYIRDDATGDIGELTGGWGLQLTVRCPLPANQPPIVTTQPLRFVHEGMEMSVQPQAYDPDGTVQELTFSVVVAQPEGVSLDPASGALAWRPPAGSAGTTNEFVITVTDTGLPAQSGMATFTAVVVPPVTIQSLLVKDSKLTITWSSAPGNWYEVQVRDDAASGLWAPVQSPVPAGDFECSLTDIAAHGPQQFFRIRVLP